MKQNYRWLNLYDHSLYRKEIRFGSNNTFVSTLEVRRRAWRCEGKPIEQTIRLFQLWRCVGENDSHRRPAESTREAAEKPRETKEKKKREERKNRKIYALALVS